jgi:multiple sugar transport system permease protein
VVAGLGLAMALNRTIPLERFFKASFYSPLVLSLVVSGLIWSWLYHPAGGLINSLLRSIGLDSLAKGWLSDKDLVMWAIIVVAVWRQVGYVMVLYLAGLQGIDPGLVDASKVDGCNGWQTFRNVIFPLLAPVTAIVVVISIIDSLRAFDLVSVMTRGGPYNSSSVLANFMYIEAFNNYKMGYGAAISVILFLISLVFIFIYLSRVMQDELEY